MNMRDRINLYKEFMGDYSNDTMLCNLEAMGFFTAPASCEHHGNYEGGLFDHSYAVADELVSLTKSLNLKWQNPRSPFIVGMFHDLCKCHDYILVKSGNTYSRNTDTLFKSHGERSLIFAFRLINLTAEEELCIRYHMGAFEPDCSEYYSRAVSHCANVLWTHTADMLAAISLGV